MIKKRDDYARQYLLDNSLLAPQVLPRPAAAAAAATTREARWRLCRSSHSVHRNAAARVGRQGGAAFLEAFAFNLPGAQNSQTGPVTTPSR